MVAYTEGFKNSLGGEVEAKSEITKGVKEANEVFHTNSSTGVKFNLVHMYEVDSGYNPSGSSSKNLKILGFLQETGSFLDEVHLKRDIYGADVVVQIQQSTDID